MENTELLVGLTPLDIITNSTVGTTICLVKLCFDQDVEVVITDADTICAFPEIIDIVGDVKALIGKPLTVSSVRHEYVFGTNTDLSIIEDVRLREIIANTGAYKADRVGKSPKSLTDLEEVKFTVFELANEDVSVLITMVVYSHFCDPMFVYSHFGDPSYLAMYVASDPEVLCKEPYYWEEITGRDFESMIEHPIEERLDDFVMVSAKIN